MSIHTRIVLHHADGSTTPHGVAIPLHIGHFLRLHTCTIQEFHDTWKSFSGEDQLELPIAETGSAKATGRATPKQPQQIADVLAVLATAMHMTIIQQNLRMLFLSGRQ
jgi:hypothetical protein